MHSAATTAVLPAAPQTARSTGDTLLGAALRRLPRATMMVQMNLWTWCGHYYGRRSGDLLVHHSGECMGIFKGHEVYDRNGVYLGEVQSGRLIRRMAKASLRGPTAPARSFVATQPYAAAGSCPRIDPTLLDGVSPQQEALALAVIGNGFHHAVDLFENPAR